MGIKNKLFKEYASLPSEQRKTFRLHSWYSMAEGTLFGTFVLNEFVFIKSLKGNDYLMGLLFTFSMAVFTLLLFGNEILRRNQNKKKLLRRTALITRLPLLIFLVFPTHLSSYIENPIWYFLFLLIILIYYMSTPVTLPTVNLLLRSSYGNKHFGVLYGYANTINKTFALLATFCFGILLDHNYFIFKWIYPIIGLIGIAGIWSLSNISYTPQLINSINKGLFVSVGNSIKTMCKILKRNRPFLNFEISFFLYGIAFMITVTVITFFMEKHLHLNYTSISAYKNLGAFVTILCMPFFGRFMGNTDPRRYSRIAYMLMAAYIAFVMITEYLPYHFQIGEYKIYYTLVIAFIIQGIFTAGMAILWYIGSAFFCRNDSLSGDYQSVHLSFVGVRALFAPLIGVYFYQNFGYSFTFAIGIFFLILAIALMYYSQWKRPNPYGNDKE
ncbi:MAG TPA: MFS transporter [Bacteroidales bacterium]|nr:MFS transporter [Bacteroidales bacterium]MDD4235341.1 MFS transporter [Bacteroidales bacterium]HXK81448.1 MFS transporter [Bacteroidales bacterium]